MATQVMVRALTALISSARLTRALYRQSTHIFQVSANSRTRIHVRMSPCRSASLSRLPTAIS